MSQVIPSVSPKEILTKVKLVFTDSQLQLHGTDLCQYLKLTASCSSMEPGIAILDYNNLRTIISKMSGEMVQVELDGDDVVMRDDRSLFELTSLSNVDEFPSINGFDPQQTMTLQVNEFVADIESIAHCMDKESTRFALASVQLRGLESQGALQLTATDGRRMAFCRIPYAGCENFAALIPYNVVRALPQIIDKTEGDCEIQISESWFGIKAADLLYSCRQVEGRFPATTIQEKMFESSSFVPVELTAMRTLASQGMVVSEEESMGVCLAMDGEAVTATHQTQKAKFRSTVEFNHPEAMITVNSQYLHQALANCKEAKLCIADNSLRVLRDGRVFEIMMGMSK